jgi:hypothetical protein
MNRILALLFFCLTVSIPSFASEHVVTHSAKVATHGSYQAGKGVVHATVAAVKFFL